MSQKISTVGIGDEMYPKLLRHIKNPPKKLYWAGDLSLASRTAVAVVGTRKATSYGMWAAAQLSEMLALHDVVVVSGLAAGIDTCSHRGALKISGKTIAVLGSGPDICTPASNRRLMKEISETGLLLSEYPPGTHASVFTFPQRNRIISGLSSATVVVEAGRASGSLITAEQAADQGREVYAVPANIDRIMSIGTNKLIKEGSLPLVVFEDLLDDLGISRKTCSGRQKNLGEAEREILSLIENAGEVTASELCRNTKKQIPEINGILTVLELKGMVYSFMGKIFIAK